jgi:uncharacterized membrane protein
MRAAKGQRYSSPARSARPARPVRRRDPLVSSCAVLRLLAVLAAILALAGAGLPFLSRGRTVVLLLDVSDSLETAFVEEERAAALALVEGLGPADRIRAAAYAGGFRDLGGPWTPGIAKSALASADLSAPDPDRTDLGSALEAGLALARAGRKGPACLVLFGDLRANSGTGASLAGLEKARIPVFVLPLGRTPSGLVSAGLAAPRRARPGQVLPLAWTVDADAPGQLDWMVLEDGREQRRGRSELRAGRNRIEFGVDAGQGGFREVEVRAIGSDGEVLPWLRAGTAFEVTGAASVLVVSSGASSGGRLAASPIVAALEAQGIPVLSGGVGALPRDAAACAGLTSIVLDDVPALELSETQQTTLSAFVAAGGGLLVVGGPSSFGRGEYYATALEDLLPVSTDSRQRLFFTRARLLFVIDHSASMAEVVGGDTKQMAAMRGVEAAIRELNPDDEVGIISFDSEPTWILPFTPASRTLAIDQAIAGITEGGGTDLGAAIMEGIQGFGQPGPTKRHIILLSDGLSASADLGSLSAALQASGISLSAIAIGSHVDETLLSGLAAANGGEYYRAEADKVPRILDQETLRLTRELIQPGPVAIEASTGATGSAGADGSAGAAIVAGLGAAPPLGGYLLTKAKPLASVWLSAVVPGGGGRRDPVLATWRYGAGRVAAFTADSGSRWLAAWKGRPEYGRLWAQSLRSIDRPAPPAGLRASVELDASVARLAVEARRPDGRAWTGLRLLARDLASGGVSSLPVLLAETAPGRYEGQSFLEAPGLHRFELEADGLPAGSTWAWYQPAAELAALGPDQAKAAGIAAASGGQILDPGAALPPSRLGFVFLPGRAVLAGLALFLLVLELGLRSALGGQLAAALAAFSAWRNRGGAEAEALRSKPYRGIPGQPEVDRGDDGVA